MFLSQYSTIIRGSQCLCIYYYQCACNISYAYVAVCYLCTYLCGVLARMVSARVLLFSTNNSTRADTIRASKPHVQTHR
jgi:hypothetical protein